MGSPSLVETIVAQTTAQGYAGVGIVRISGPLAPAIASKMLGEIPKHRYAEYRSFVDLKGDIIDQGIALYFKGPQSFTGEDILEFQAHGGPIILDRLVNTAVKAGARMARPGEFLERAFWNQKLDLIQAEAIHDLIHAKTEAAAKGAARSMQGNFSKVIEDFSTALITLRMFVEAAIDFPEESLELMQEGQISSTLKALIEKARHIKDSAKQGALLSQGIKVVIAGKPNAGKSSLLNALSGYEAAIVTDIPGTTRDVLKEEITIDGLRLQLIDTAGFRKSLDAIETQGIVRAKKEVELADHLLLMIDASEPNQDEKIDLAARLPEFPELESLVKKGLKITLIFNKIDLIKGSPRQELLTEGARIFCSVKTGEGISVLREHLKSSAGYSAVEGTFSARQRHVDAIDRATQSLLTAEKQLETGHPLELLAEELKGAQWAMDEINGKFSSDDLLGKIFLEFCIGK